MAIVVARRFPVFFSTILNSRSPPCLPDDILFDRTKDFWGKMAHLAAFPVKWMSWIGIVFGMRAAPEFRVGYGVDPGRLQYG